MSKCKYDRLSTTITGTVIDAGNRKPMSGVQLFVIDSSKLKTYDVVTSNSDGSYVYTFTPASETGNYCFQIVTPKNYISNYPSRTVLAGFNDVQDVYLQKMVDMNLHLINNSVPANTISASNVIYGCCYVFSYLNRTPINPRKRDTTFHVKIPNYSEINIGTQFNYSNGTADILSYHFNSGANDTTITIVNP